MLAYIFKPNKKAPVIGTKTAFFFFFRFFRIIYIYIHTHTHTHIYECLLVFGAESAVIQVAVQKFKDQDI